MGARSRRKGANGEREVVQILRAHGFECDRVPNSGGLWIPGDVAGLAGYHLEVKRAERLQLPEWLRQARDEAPDGAVPVVVHRRNGEPWYATFPFEAFCVLVAL